MDNSVPVQKFTLGSIESIVPVFGLWCGPGWSAGKRGELDSPLYFEVARVSNKFGDIEDSKLDSICMVHDMSYFLAKGLPNEAMLKTQADATFLNDLSSAYSSLTPSERPYASVALLAFSAKMLLVNPVLIGVDFFKDVASSALKLVRENSTPTNPFVELAGENTGGSLVTTADGQIVAGFSQSGEKVTLAINPECDVIEMLLQRDREPGDDFGEYDTLRIQRDMNSTVSQVSHSVDGVEDFKGVVVGQLTQEKLDEFIDKGTVARDFSSSPVLQMSEPIAERRSTVELFNAIDTSLDGYALSELDSWFFDADPILMAPYQWERIDSSLESFWYRGNDEAVAAYDLWEASQDVSWHGDRWLEIQTDFNTDPWVSDFTSFADYALTEPLYYAGSGGISNFGDTYFSDVGLSSYSTTQHPDYFFSYIDPLVMKLGGGSVHTTNLVGSKILFDMNGDGDKDRTGWITADHAFLVRDINKNGKIDNVSEMFSEQMSNSAGSGFAALAELDTKRNGRIDKNDKAFGELRLWTDINANGVTDKGELHKLGRFGVKSIDLNHVVARNQYDNGNMVLGTASYSGVRDGMAYTGEIAEVLFNFGDHAPVANVYLSDQATTMRTADGKVIEVLKDDSAQKVNASLSGVNVLIGGIGDVLSAGKAGQSLLIGNGGATLNGNSGIVHFIVNGSKNVVNTGTGTSVIEVHGDDNTINASKGKVEIDVEGSRNKISIGSHADVDLAGIANILTALSKSKGNGITVSGVGQVINASNADISIKEHASLALTGKNNAIAMAGDATLTGKASGGTLTVAGDDNRATLDGAFIAITEDAELTLTGTKHQIVLAGEAALVMNSSGKGSNISVFGEDNQLTASKATITLAEGAGLALTGAGSKLVSTGDSRLDVNGTGHQVDVYGSDNVMEVDRSTINERGFAELDLTGVGNTLKVTSDYSSAARNDLKVLAKAGQTLQQTWDRFDRTVDAAFGPDWAPEDDHGVVVDVTGVSSTYASLIEPAIV